MGVMVTFYSPKYDLNDNSFKNHTINASVVVQVDIYLTSFISGEFSPIKALLQIRMSYSTYGLFE